jgi:lipid-A-disaccharide synthase
VTDLAEKQAAFRIARAALAKSGTVTLELALAGVPTVAAYKVSTIDAWLFRRLASVPSVILANLVIGENVVPELLQEDCTPERLATALVPIIEDTAERRRQIEAFARLDTIMEIGARAPALRAAEIVLAMLRSAGVPFAGAATNL